MRIITWNINGLAPTLKNIELKYPRGLRDFFDDTGADIVCLQETKLKHADIKPALSDVEGFESFWATSAARKGYCGVATYVRLPYAASAAQTDECLQGPAELKTEGRLVVTEHADFTLLNAYVPNAGDRPDRARLGFKLAWLAALAARINALHSAGREVVLVGDLNVPRSVRDVSPLIEWEGLYSAAEIAAIEKLLENLHDAWRERHPGVADAFTVWSEKTSARPANRGLRIDYTLISPGLRGAVRSCEMDYSLPPKWSDHCPVVLDLDGIVQHPVGNIPAPCKLSSRRAAARSLAGCFARAAPRTTIRTSPVARDPPVRECSAAPGAMLAVGAAGTGDSTVGAAAGVAGEGGSSKAGDGRAAAAACGGLGVVGDAGAAAGGYKSTGSAGSGESDGENGCEGAERGPHAAPGGSGCSRLAGPVSGEGATRGRVSGLGGRKRGAPEQGVPGSGQSPGSKRQSRIPFAARRKR